HECFDCYSLILLLMFLYCYSDHRDLPSFPTRRSSDLIDPFFAVLWIIGGACAVAAAWSAKYHRLAALLLIGGTGLATSVTFLMRSEEHTSELQSRENLVCRLLLEKKKQRRRSYTTFKS